MVNHRVDNRVDPCRNQCCKTSIHWRSINEKLFTMLSDLKSATIIGHSDYVGDGVGDGLKNG